MQTPRKKPKSSDIGWWAHDPNNSNDANSAAVYICLDGFIVSLAIEIVAPCGAWSFFVLTPGLASWAIICRPSGTGFRSGTAGSEFLDEDSADSLPSTLRKRREEWGTRVSGGAIEINNCLRLLLLDCQCRWSLRI